MFHKINIKIILYSKNFNNNSNLNKLTIYGKIKDLQGIRPIPTAVNALPDAENAHGALRYGGVARVLGCNELRKVNKNIALNYFIFLEFSGFF
jgi:hypothetical protein